MAAIFKRESLQFRLEKHESFLDGGSTPGPISVRGGERGGGYGQDLIVKLQWEATCCSLMGSYGKLIDDGNNSSFIRNG